MARKQKLINLHSFGTETSALLTGPDQLTLGEIAVQHVDGAAKLHIRVSSGNEVVENKLASFIDESAIDQKISSAKTQVTGLINDLSDTIGSGFTKVNTVAKAIADEQKARKDGDKDLEDAISALTDTVKDEVAARKQTDAALSGVTDNLTDALGTLQGRVHTAEDNIETIQGKLTGITGTVKEYVDNSVSALTNDSLQKIESAAKAQGDFAEITVTEKADRKQTVGISLTAVTLANAGEQNNGLAIAYDVKQVTNAIDGRLSTAETALSAAERDIDGIQSQLSGFGATQGAVKTYVDDAISSAVSSVYKIKGSVENYASLPSTDLTEGDVYNVEAAATVDGKYYPAGTNWVWVSGTPSGHWDPLGGTIDLSPYLYISAFTAYTAATETRLGKIEGDLTAETKSRQDAITEINGKIGGSFSSSNTIADAISNETTARTSADTALDNKITAETQARQNAVSALTSSAETLGQNITNETNRAQSAETSLNNAITAETKTRQDADTALSGRIDKLSTASTELHDLITAETQARKNADSALTTSVETNAQGITDINQKLGNGFTSANTVTTQLAAVKSTADGAVQSITVKNTATNGITATEDTTTHNVELDFDNMVIDCGTY